MFNRFLIAAFLLLLLELSHAFAAGPYDGEWTGNATSSGERCKRAVLSLMVEGRVVLGQAKFEGDTPAINGTVSDNGAVGATIGFQFLKGQFTGDEFEGSFSFSNCEWEAILKRTGGGDRNRAASSRLQRR